MPDRIFRLLELAQKLDARLRSAQARRIPDPLEITRLRQKKQRLGQRIAAFSVGLMARPLSA